MKRFLRNLISKKLAPAFLMAVIVGSSLPFPVLAAPTIDLKVNGEDGPVTLDPGDTFTYTWDSTGATACEMTSPLTSGISLSGSGDPIDSSHPNYPTVGSPVTITISCTDGTETETDSVTVSLSSATPAAPTVDVDVNGSDGPVTVNSTDSFTYSWTSANATACEMTSPLTSGISLNGTGDPIDSTHPNFPTSSSPLTITISCTNGTDTATDSVVVNLASGTPGSPTVDVDANGSDGPVTLNSGDTYTYSWTSSNATACQMTSPLTSGVSLNGNGGPIGSGDPNYPAAGSPVTITISCTDGTDTATDSVVISLSSGTPGSPTVDVDANGSDGPVTLNSGDSYTYTWTSSNATACQMTAPLTSGVSLNGSSAAITSADAPFYPTTSAAITITISCTNGTDTATDSVVINLAGGPSGSSPTIDVKANGSDGPVVLHEGDSYVYTWDSSNATACQMTAPLTSGVSLDGSSTSIDSGDTQFYPTESSDITITISCTDGTETATDSVIIRFEDDDGGGGGGGGGRRRNRANVNEGEVLGAATECPWIKDYMRIDFQNDPMEVMKLQAFLKVFMGYDYVTINGVFDEATYAAVGAFQMLYKDEILTPWGHTAPTYYVYILTLKKVNEIYCQQVMPLTMEQANEIVTFKGQIQTVRDSGIEIINTKEGPVEADTQTPISLPIVGEGGAQGQNLRGLAAALFTFPDDLKDTMQCLYELALILLVLYILGTVLKDVLYPDVPENTTKRFLAKWVTLTVGSLAALVLSFSLQEFCLILPLIASTVGSLIWMSFFPRHDSLKAWYQTTFKKEGKQA